MSKVLLEDRDTETLRKQLKTNKILKLVFIISGILMILGSLALILMGFVYGMATILAIILTAGYADVSGVAAQGVPAFISGIVLFPIGLAVLIAGTIVTSVKIRNRRDILLERGEIE